MAPKKVIVLRGWFFGQSFPRERFWENVHPVSESQRKTLVIRPNRTRINRRSGRTLIYRNMQDVVNHNGHHVPRRHETKALRAKRTCESKERTYARVLERTLLKTKWARRFRLSIIWSWYSRCYHLLVWWQLSNLFRGCYFYLKKYILAGMTLWILEIFFFFLIIQFSFLFTVISNYEYSEICNTGSWKIPDQPLSDSSRISTRCGTIHSKILPRVHLVYLIYPFGIVSCDTIKQSRDWNAYLITFPRLFLNKNL
jgi:hypothetical protein